jgi:hypothetical protein
MGEDPLKSRMYNGIMGLLTKALSNSVRNYHREKHNALEEGKPWKRIVSNSKGDQRLDTGCVI